MIIIALILILLVFAQTIIKPVVFALIFSIMLRPLCNWFDRWMPWSWLSVLLTFLTALLPIVGLGYIFFIQFRDVISDLPSVTDKLEKGINSLSRIVENNMPEPMQTDESWLQGATSGLIDTVQAGLSTSSAVLASIFITFLYTFLILLYRKSFRLFLVSQCQEQVQ